MIKTIKHCPSCGSDKIKRKKGKWKDTYKGQTYTVPELEFEECPVCGEQLFDREAMRLMQHYCPAYRKQRHRRAA